MERRAFMAGSVAASAMALSGAAMAQSSSASAGEFYELRCYRLQSGPQVKLTESFAAEGLLPALNRLGHAPVGVFHLDIGPETPAMYVLIPGTSLDALATLDQRLARDEAFRKAAEPFWSAPAAAPAFHRYESSLMAAFHGWPKLTPPSATATHAKRIFQLRTYESPSNGAHVRKVEMFHDGEFEIFLKAGFAPIFFGDVLTGDRLPKLTYMLAFTDLAELSAKWDVFRNDPAWKKLSGSQRYAYEAIVSNIDNLILSPAACSQV